MSESSDGNDTQQDGEDGVPDLDEDVYYRPFEGVDTSSPEEIIEATREIDQKAAMTIQNVVVKNSSLEDTNEELREELERTKTEFSQFKERVDRLENDKRGKLLAEIIHPMLSFRDNLKEALEHGDGGLKQGIQLIADDFDQELEQQGVEIISPEQGDELDNQVHKVMSTVEDETKSGRIVDCYRPGYVVNDYVIRPARVSVSA